MNRLQKKCTIVSAGIHLLLVVILVVGPGFLGSRDKPARIQYIDIIPPKVIEGVDAGGGKPNALPPPPTPAPAPQPEPTPVPPQPQPQAQPQPPKLSHDALEVHQKLPKISLTPVRRPQETKPRPTETSDDQAQAQAQAQAKADAARRARVYQNFVQNLKEGLTSSTSIDVPGPGGEAYAGYETVLQSIYKARYDEELAGAGDIARGKSEVETSVTVARDGSVVRHRITGRSSNAALNDLVQRVLTRVVFIHAFPEGAKDSERTFNIIFDLKPKQGMG
jgi:outer membrane biosynthesis protein TonB